MASRSQELAELTADRKYLQAESEKLLAAHFADAIDLDTLKRHQDRVRAGPAEIDRKLAGAMNLLTYCATMYRQSDDEAKRLATKPSSTRSTWAKTSSPSSNSPSPSTHSPPTRFRMSGVRSRQLRWR